MFLITLLSNHIFWIALWTVVFIASVLVEVATAQLVSIWFAGAAIVSLILAICGVHFGVQLIVWVVASFLLLFLFKVLFGKKLALATQRTNYDSLIGEEILITKKVTKEVNGEGKYRDVIWTIKCDQTLEAGEYAIIKNISGNKLIVNRKEK